LKAINLLFGCCGLFGDQVFSQKRYLLSKQIFHDPAPTRLLTQFGSKGKYVNISMGSEQRN
jgi:hypothetical protein